MSMPIALRDDFDAAALRGVAKATKDAAQGRRLLALAEIYDGGTRTDAARIGGVGLQTIRDWVLAFNADGPAGLIDGKAPGNPSKLNGEQRQALARRKRTDPGDPWRSALAVARPCLVGVRGVPYQPGRDDGQPRGAQARLPQAVGASAASRAERARHGCF
jgi:transposase